MSRTASPSLSEDFVVQYDKMEQTEKCNAPGPDGHVCRLPVLHTGKHISFRNGYFKLWEQDDDDWWNSHEHE